MPEPPTVPAPPIPSDAAPTSDAQPPSTTHFSTVRSEVRAGAICIDITDPAGDTAILWNQEAKRVRDIGSLIFETPIQHDYEAGVEVRSLLSTERLGEINGRLAVTDEHSHGTRYVKFWVDDAPSRPTESRSPIGGEAPSRASPHQKGTHRSQI